MKLALYIYIYTNIYVYCIDGDVITVPYGIVQGKLPQSFSKLFLYNYIQYNTI